MDLEIPQDKHQLAAALLRGVKVENRLRRVTERARLPIDALDPARLTNIAQHGGGVENMTREDRCPRPCA